MATETLRATTRAGKAWSWPSSRIGDAEVRIALGGAMLVSAVLSLWFGRNTTFYSDELHLFSSSPNLDLRAAIEPYNGHLVLIPRLAYAGILNTFGAGYLPFRLLTIATVLLTAGLFFEFAKRRIGALAALAPTLVLLFYGSDANHLISGRGFGVLFPLAAGIGALLALEREDLRGDLGACLLLCLAIATFSVGLAFVAGAAVLIMIGADRWRRAWVVLIPAVLYGAWFVWSRSSDVGFNVPGITQINIQVINVLLAPIWAVDSLAKAGAGLVGLDYPPFQTDLGPMVAAVALAALGFRLWRGNIQRWLWAAMAVPATLWLIGAAASAPPGRLPTDVRYIIPVTIAVLLVAVEAARGVRVERRGIVALYVVAAISLATNIALLRDGSKELRAEATTTRADLAAVEIGGGRLAPPVAIASIFLRGTGQPADQGRVGPRPPADSKVPLVRRVPKGSYLATGYMQAVRQFGSPAFSLPELRALPQPLRWRVDGYLADSLGLHLQPTSTPGRQCRRITGNSRHVVSFKLPTGGAVLRTKGAAAPLDLRRFGTTFTVHVGALPPGVPMALRIPRDSAPDAWYASTTTSPMLVCGLRG